jgi:hypothetical protein
MNGTITKSPGDSLKEEKVHSTPNLTKPWATGIL